MLGTPIEQNHIVTVTTAAQMAGADRKTIRKVFQRNGLATEDIADGRRDHRVGVAAEDVEGRLRKLKGALTVPQAMERLGIERRQLEAIVGSVTGLRKLIPAPTLLGSNYSRARRSVWRALAC